MAKGKSRPKRWDEAAAACGKAIEELQHAAGELEAAAADLRSIQEEYEEWKEGLPENLANSTLAEKLDAVCELGIEDMASTITDAISEASDIVSEAEAAELPRGFGRD